MALMIRSFLPALSLGLALMAMPTDAAAQTNFGSVNLGSSATATATVTIPNAATLASVSVLMQGAANLDFTETSGGTCTLGQSYSAKATCTVNVAFSPKYPGVRNGAVVLADAASNVIGTAYLQGTGQGPQVAFVPGTQTTVLTGFINPVGVAVDGAGNIYVSDAGTYSSKTGIATGGAAYKETLSNGQYSQSTIGVSVTGPQGITLDGAGNLYISNGGCLGNGAVGCWWPNPDCIPNFNGAWLCKETLQPNGKYVETAILYGSPVGLGPYGVAVDAAGNVYIADNTSNAALVFQELLQPDGTYVAGSSVFLGAYIYGLYGITLDPSGNLYVTLSENTQNLPVNYTYGQAFKLTPSGNTYTPTVVSGPSLGFPDDIAADSNGAVYISNLGNGPSQYGVGPGVYRWIPQSGGTYTYSVLGPGFKTPYAVTTDTGGNVYVTDAGTNPPAVIKLDLSSPAALTFASTPQGSTSADSPQTVTVINSGNMPLTFSEITYPADFSPNSLAANACSTSVPLAAGESCALAIDFTPSAALNGKTSLPLSESITVATNTLNTTTTTQLMAVSGTETSPVAATPVISPAGGTYNATQSVTITDTTPGAAIFYTTDGTTPTTNSTPYTAAITVSQNENVEAIAVANGYVNSAVDSVTYFIALADFSVGVAPASLSVSSGQPAQATVSVTPVNNFASAVSFTCSGLPAGTSCSFSPQSVTPSGGLASTTLTVSKAAAARALAAERGNPFPFLSGLVLAIALGIPGRRNRRRGLLPPTMVVLGLGLLVGCGGGSYSSPPPPVTATVTVSASAGALQHSTTFVVTVN